jgi:hypothetical protein
MANIFGVNVETPQEQQARLLEQIQMGQKNLQNVNQQFGYNLAIALSQSFGGLGKKRRATEERVEAISMAGAEAEQSLGRARALEQGAQQQTLQNADRVYQAALNQGMPQQQASQIRSDYMNQYQQTSETFKRGITEQELAKMTGKIIKEGGVSNYQAQQLANANVITALTKLGGTQNLALAAQYRQRSQQMAVEEEQRLLESQKLKAGIRSSESAIEVNESRLMASRPLEELTQMLQSETSPAKRAQLKGHIEERKRARAKEDRLEMQAVQAAAREERRVSVAEQDLTLQEEKEERLSQKLGSSDAKSLVKTNEQWEEQQMFLSENDQTLQAVARAQASRTLPLAGKALQINEEAKQISGITDEDVSIAYKLRAKTAITRALSLRGPGQVSNFEFAHYLSAVPSKDANAETWKEYLRLDSWLRAENQAYAEFRADYISGVEMEGVPSSGGKPRGSKGLLAALKSQGPAVAARVEEEYSRENWDTKYNSYVQQFSPDGGPVEQPVAPAVEEPEQPETREERRRRLLEGG